MTKNDNSSVDLSLLYFILGLTLQTVHAAEQTTYTYLRGFQFAGDDESDGERQLQQYTISIPILPILLIICCICICMQKQKQDQAAINNNRATAHAAAAAVAVGSTPQLVTAAATKFEPKASVGVSFTGKDHAKISGIKAESIFKDSGLQVGMRVVSINNTPIGSAAEAVVIIQESTDVVTILAHSAGYYGQTESLVTATAKKESPEEPLGIVFSSNSSNNTVQISTIKETSSLLQTELASGMQVAAVNNIAVMSPAHARELARAAFPLVTLLARRTAAVAVAVNADDEPVTAVATVLVDSSPLATDQQVAL